MMRQIVLFVALFGGVVGFIAVTTVGCNSGDTTGTGKTGDMSPCSSFAPAAECLAGTLPIKPLSGSRQMVISSLTIADANQGFDLNCDGKPDNLLAPLNAVANGPIAESFQTKHDVIIPIEVFGYDGKDSACTKFAFYLGRVVEDRDGDGADTTWAPGKSDCDDTDPSVHPGAGEIIGNFMDDDCDGYADNKMPNTPSDDKTDHDGDGQSMSAGDCDDRNDTPAHKAIAAARHKGAKDICGNGIDEDCDGIADNDPSCDPFGDNVAPMHAVSLSFSNAPMGLDGGVLNADSLKPYITFPDGKVSSNLLTAGPDLFELNLNLGSDLDLKLTLSAARVKFKLADKPNGLYVTDGTLGGVLEAVSLAQIHLDAGSILKKEQSLLDAIFVGAGSAIIALPLDKDGLHYTPDIDVDGDGLEAFWQEDKHTIGDGGAKIDMVDTCRDGDGTIVKNNWDGKGGLCALAKDAKGNFRFVDGLSAALKFTTVPAKLVDVVVK